MSETLHLEGDLYIETFTNNVSNGVIGPVDVNSLEVKPDSDKISIPSKRKGKLGQARETYFVPKPATVTIKTSEIPPVLLAAAFMGLESPINQGAGTLTELPVTLLAHPKWVSLGKTNLSATGLVVKEGAAKPSINTDAELKAVLNQAKSVAYSDSASGVYVEKELFKKLGMPAKGSMIERLPVAEQWQVLGRLTRLPSGAVSAAMRPLPAQRLSAADFTRQVANLQTLRNAL